MSDAPHPTQSSVPDDREARGWTPPPEEIGRLLPNYDVLSLLGRGGMGAVYLAVQRALDRAVAIKLLPLEISADPDFADRFVREAQAMAKLHHPNLIAIHDFGKTGEGHLYIVMEYVDGANLHEMIHGPGLSPAQSLAIAAQVCEALAYAHAQGVVHRDIKPANVMVDQAGHAKLADFGLARLTDPTAEHLGSTMTGTIMGTPDYMAPEQRKGMQVDHRADIYSLGVMIYEMLCGEVPRGVFEPPSRRVECDTRVDQVVTRAMQQEPRQRYQSTQEMKTDVDAARTPLAKAESDQKRRFSTTGENGGAGTTAVKNRRSLVWAIAACVLVGAVAFFLWEKGNASRAARASESSPALQREPAADGLKPATALPSATPAAPTATLTPPVPAQAGQIVTFAGHRYQFVPGNVSWTAAKAKAESVGGHLATVTSKEENTWLKKTFDAFMATEPNKNCWLGGYAENRTAPWQWVTGEPFEFQDWHVSEPNYDYGPENPAPPPYAIHFHRKERWDSPWLESAVRFNRIAGYIVEWDTAEEPAKAKAARNPPIPLSPAPTAATKDAPFVNTLGMKFVPVPITGGPADGQRGSPEATGLPLGSPGNQPPRFPSASSVPGAATSMLFSVWDTRVQDYAAFATETQRDWKKPEFEQGLSHPAVMVSWEDATAFCAWLTERERKAGKLGANERYRLPSDHEWSCAVGIGAREDAAKLPSEKDGKITDAFPSGTQWPPLQGAGNYAGEELQPDREAGKFKSAKAQATDKAGSGDFVASGYNDGFVNTSPVGSFAANHFGLHDLGGNVRQWCEDWFDGNQTERVLRGASWNGRRRNVLLSSARNRNAPTNRGHFDGFRCVLAGPAAAPSAAPPR